MDKLLYNPFIQEQHFSKEEAERMQNELFRVKVLDNKEKIVAHCASREEAQENIRRRMRLSPILGIGPKKYKIKVIPVAPKMKIHEL